MESTVKERIVAFINAKNISTREFERMCGVSYGYVAQLRKSPTVDKLERILNAYPEINKHWLITGEGDMFRSSVSQTSTGNNNTQVAGNGNNVVTSSKNPSDLVEKLVSENIELRKELSKQMQASNENISRLISLLEAERGINNSTTEN